VRWFLAGYTACSLLIGLFIAIVKHSTGGLLIVPGVLMIWLGAPLGLIVGMLGGFSPGMGPWDGRLVFMGLVAGLAVLVAAGLWLGNRHRCTNPVLDGGDGTPRVPTVRVVTARRAYRLATVTWDQLIGRMLLAIAGAGLFCLGCIGLGCGGTGC
jgi:hypothetical protein